MPGTVSRWIQRRANARTSGRIRRKGGALMGMDVLILHTVGRRSEQPRETPLAWFPEGDDAWLVVASGGGNQDPDWFVNVMARPDHAAIEFHGGGSVPVWPHRLESADRERAWRHITAAMPRMAKYQSKSDRKYPVVRLTRR